MSARGKARRRALEILFEAQQRGITAQEGLAVRRAAEQVINPYTVQIVDGVTSEQDRIDEILSSYAQGWTLDRMPAVDLIILRIGSWELLFNEEVPDSVAVAESVSLAKELSTDASPDFVNGLLGRLQQLKPTLLA